jgi:hypothetical protein
MNFFILTQCTITSFGFVLERKGANHYVSLEHQHNLNFMETDQSTSGELAGNVQCTTEWQPNFKCTGEIKETLTNVNVTAGGPTLENQCDQFCYSKYVKIVDNGLSGTYCCQINGRGGNVSCELKETANIMAAGDFKQAKCIVEKYLALDGCSTNSDDFEGLGIGFYRKELAVAGVVCCDDDPTTPCIRVDVEEPQVHVFEVRNVVTGERANRECANRGKHLCASQEELNTCCGETGVYAEFYDNHIIWTGYQFDGTYNKTAIDGCPTNRAQTPDMGEDYRDLYSIPTNDGAYETNDKAGVACCKVTPLEIMCDRIKKDDDKCLQPNHDLQNWKNVTYLEATKFCKNYKIDTDDDGWNLCTREQMEKCCRKGCGLDNEFVWMQ